MIAVIDTNVLLSAALRDRLPERAVYFIATSDDWSWLVTEQILQEYIDVLKRPKFHLSQETVDAWTELLALHSVKLETPPMLPDFPRDPKDAPFLAAAIGGAADFLITGDRDLLDVRATLAVRVVTVAEFAAEFAIG